MRREILFFYLSSNPIMCQFKKYSLWTWESSLGYLVSWSPAWAIQEILSKNRQKHKYSGSLKSYLMLLYTIICQIQDGLDQKQKQKKERIKHQ